MEFYSIWIALFLLPSATKTIFVFAVNGHDCLQFLSKQSTQNGLDSRPVNLVIISPKMGKLLQLK